MILKMFTIFRMNGVTMMRIEWFPEKNAFHSMPTAFISAEKYVYKLL